MSDSSIGVAVIGAGMAGRAHINGYRAASTVFGSGLPEIRLVAVADAHEPFAADAEAMAEAAGKSDRVAAVGFTFRRSPAVNAIREQITGGSLGKVMHFNGHYWCDYGFSKDAPMSWRYKGGPGSGALSDIGSHL